VEYKSHIIIFLVSNTFSFSSKTKNNAPFATEEKYVYE